MPPQGLLIIFISFFDILDILVKFACPQFLVMLEPVRVHKVCLLTLAVPLGFEVSNVCDCFPGLIELCSGGLDWIGLWFLPGWVGLSCLGL